MGTFVKFSFAIEKHLHLKYISKVHKFKIIISLNNLSIFVLQQDHCRGVYLLPGIKGEEILCVKNPKEKKMYTRNMKPCKKSSWMNRGISG